MRQGRVSGIMSHYDPNRLTKPLRRTNPKKGLDEDPALEGDLLGRGARRDRGGARSACAPRIRASSLMQRTTTVTASAHPVPRLRHGLRHAQHLDRRRRPALRQRRASASAASCTPPGRSCRTSSTATTPSISAPPRATAPGHASNSNMGLAADARARGMKMVVVDPMCNFAAAKATEWVPMRVGTDAALALAMCNVLVNELGVIDAPYLQAKTNAPYLIGPDKRYVRDAGDRTSRWSGTRAAGAARPFADVAAADMALEGEFEVDGVACQPAFQKLQGPPEEIHARMGREDHHRAGGEHPPPRRRVRARGAHRQHHRGRRRDPALPAGGGDRLPRLAGPHELALQLPRRRPAQPAGRRRRRGRRLPRLQPGVRRLSRKPAARATCRSPTPTA